jgi:carbon monoxide dehydrogenase subunit G
MPLDETAEITIRRSPQEVAAYMFDPAHDPNWIGGISEAERLDGGPIAAGSRVRRRASFMGRRIDYVMEIVTFEPDRRLVMHAIQAPMPMDVTYEVEPSGSDARARVRVQGHAGNIYRIASPLIGVQVRRSITSDVERLKRILEDSQR